MSRWVIYKGDEVLGPMTAAEIREALRDGVIDPFDQVAKEGSSLRRELVEVDEIFETSRIEYADEIPWLEQEGEPAPEVEPAVGDVEVAPGGGGYIPSRDTLVSRRPVTGHGETPVNALALIERHASWRNRRDPKRFHLVDDRGRVLGPLSAKEIQSLYYKGVLTRSVKVLKEGSTSSVPVDKFVAVYSESKRPRRGARQGAHPIVAGLPSSRQMHRMAVARQAELFSRQKLLQTISLVIMIIALACAGYAMWLQYGGSSEPSRAQRVERRPAPKKRPSNPSGKLPRPKSFKSKSKAETKAPARRAVTPKTKAQPVKERAVAKKTPSKQRLTSNAPKTNQPARPAFAAPTRAKTLPPKVLTTPTPVTKAPAKPVAAAQPKSPPKPQGPTVSSLINGMNVYDLGPLTFNRAAVQSCQTKCSVVMSGAGGSVTVKFFKSLWGPPLLAKSGAVYISGLVQKNGPSVTILLNDVK